MKKKSKTLFDFSSFIVRQGRPFQEHAFKTTKNFDNLFFPKLIDEEAGHVREQRTCTRVSVSLTNST
jgi:hypothetical protein